MGDWHFSRQGNLTIRVSAMSDPRYETLVAVHELIEAILQGRQPVALTATRLTELDLPLDWTEQQKLLAS